MLKLSLFGTLGCHLCEDAELILAAFERVEIEKIDIAEQTQWQDLYAIRIPVLYHPATEKELGWPFTASDIEKFITELSK